MINDIRGDTITAANIYPSQFVIGNIRINVRTGEVQIPEDMELTEASRKIWEGIQSYAKGEFK